MNVLLSGQTNGLEERSTSFRNGFFFLFKLPQTKLARQVNNNKKMYDCQRSGQMMARELFLKKSRDVHNFLSYARESYQFSFRRRRNTERGGGGRS